nr:(-)-alpha-trans-bergamotene synthase [Stachybotrys sp.]
MTASTPSKGLENNEAEAHHSPRTFSERVRHIITVFWLLTESNAPTFVAPNTVFGICGALSGSWIIQDASYSGSVTEVLSRLVHVVLFNWTNLFIFDLANQRLDESAKEDALNKPWRPVPRGLITSAQIQRTMLYLIPAVVAFNHYFLRMGPESMAIMILTWLYNDLRGGDEGFIQRNLIIAVAFGIYNTGSVKVAAGPDATQELAMFSGLTTKGLEWAFIVSVAIFTTMQVQDLQDAEGDRARGRRSAPIILGETAARWTVVVPMLIWPGLCAWYWDTGMVLGGTEVLLGTYVAVRCLLYSDPKADKITWQLWCLWTALIYTLPPLARHLS